MNPSRAVLLCLALGAAVLRAQDNATPGSPAGDAPATPQGEMQKWIATKDAQWQAACKRDVTDMHEAELNKVKLQYMALIEEGIAKASKADDLNGAVALRDERKRFGDTNVFPEQDAAADTAGVKQIRVVIRGQLAKLEKDNAVRTKGLHAKYDQVLAQAQTQLTERQRLDDALLVKAKRDEVAAEWLTSAEPATISPTAQPASLPKTTKENTQPKSAAHESDISKALAGTWRLSFESSGWTALRVFDAGGTFAAEAKRDGGKWKISADRIRMTYVNGTVDDIILPLDPADTKVVGVVGRPGRVYKAVKEK